MDKNKASAQIIDLAEFREKRMAMEAGSCNEVSPNVSGMMFMFWIPVWVPVPAALPATRVAGTAESGNNVYYLR